MKRFLLGTAALVALGVPAFAADMPARPLPPAAPVFSWTGCYVGMYVGYATGTSYQSSEPGSLILGSTGAVAPLGTPGGAAITPHFHLGGMLGGGTGGCQYQMGVWVFGIEADGGMSNKDGQSFDQLPFNPTFVHQTAERWTTTVRGRLGYAVDKWLFFVTGGASWAGVEATDWQGCPIPFVGAVSACPGGGTITAAGVPTIQQKQTMFGYNVGAGIEYALGYGWSIKSEYIYMNFRSKDFFAPPDMISCCVAPTFVSPVRVSLYDHTFKWGLNYKFY